ncbi:MAG: hypothetical protein KF830_08160 [Planctomycetes bacterium]|nr:hypothetical protein [Planctomycetota bacterium]
MRATPWIAALLPFVACGETPPRPPAARPLAPPPSLAHDFGVIPHGSSRQHDFLLDLAALEGEWVALHVHLDCSCGRAQLLLRAADGQERPVDGRPSADNRPRPGEQLVARIVIDTAEREAVDLPATTSRGQVVLQSLADASGRHRQHLPLLLHFGVDAPVVLQPFAALDLDRVPTCRTGEAWTTLRGDEGHPQVRFVAVETSDPALDAVLEPADGHTLLRVRCRPTTVGNHRALVGVRTDLPDDYTVRLPVTWKVVPELEALPMAKLSFRADLGREQTQAEAHAQFLVLTDHDATRTAEFVLRQLVDDAGEDARAAFAVDFAPVPGQPRQCRLHVRYLGGHPDGFRGRMVIARPDTETPQLAIDLVAFPSRKP